MEPEVWLTWLYSLYSGNVPIRSDMSKQDYLTDYLEDRNIHYFRYTCIYHWQNPIHPYNKPITKWYTHISSHHNHLGTQEVQPPEYFVDSPREDEEEKWTPHRDSLPTKAMQRPEHSYQSDNHSKHSFSTIYTWSWHQQLRSHKVVWPTIIFRSTTCCRTDFVHLEIIKST